MKNRMRKPIKILKKCEKLPSPLNPKLGIGELREISYALYEEFLDNNNFLKYDDKILVMYLNAFDHIVSKSKSMNRNSKNFAGKNSIRLFDRIRLCTFPWFLHIVEKCLNSDCSNIKVYLEKRKDFEQPNLCIICNQAGYKIIFTLRNPRDNNFVLVTAYPDSRIHSDFEPFANNNRMVKVLR